MLFPFLWMVSSSLKSQLEIFNYPPNWSPNPPRFQNYVDAMTIPLFFGGGAFNIFLLRQFFRTIPEELADAARIMLPLAAIMVIPVIVLLFFAQRYFIKGIVMTGLKG